VTAADVGPPRGYLHQGAVYAGVPLLWYTDLALALRPRSEGDYRQLQVERASKDAGAFVSNHLAVAWAKRRPVVVLSPRQELRRGVIRALSVHGYGQDEQLSKARRQIERGDVPGMVHVAGNEALGWTASAIALGPVIELPRTVLDGDYVAGVREACSLSDTGLALVLSQLRTYLALTDRGRPRL
jgi:hypothetical protein